MSSPLAIGAVSAVLRDLLYNGLIDLAEVGGVVKISALAPDLIKVDDDQEPLRLNLFLYAVTPNAAWRNQNLPSHAPRGERIANPPLALDLHYLVTAYGREDFQAEILLGYAMHLLHEQPLLDSASIRAAIAPTTLDVGILPLSFQALSASDLAEQREPLRITPATMGSDEMSKLWSAFQTHYRPSAAYVVSVVLIDSRRPARAPLPVLSRGQRDPISGREAGVLVQAGLGPSVPTLLAAEPPAQQLAARLGEAVTVHGAKLAGSQAVALLRHRLLAAPIEIPVTTNDAGTGFSLPLANDAAAQIAYAAGLWQLSLRLQPAGQLQLVETNVVPLAIAANPLLAPPLAVIRDADGVEVQLQTSPRVRLGQRAQLSLDGDAAEAASRASDADPLVFRFPASVPAGPRWLRLRVDGIDSPLVLRDGAQPRFDPGQTLVVPA